MEFDALQSIIDIYVMNLLGWLIPTSQQLFPALSRGFPQCTGPRFFAKTGSFSRELIIPFRVRVCHNPTANLRQQLPFLEFGPFSRHEDKKSFYARFSTRRSRFKPCLLPTQPVGSTLSVSHTLDGLFLFIP